RIDALKVDPEGSGVEALTQNVSARSAGYYGLGNLLTDALASQSVRSDITVTKLCVWQQNCLTGSLRTLRAQRLLSFRVIGFANRNRRRLGATHLARDDNHSRDHLWLSDYEVPRVLYIGEQAIAIVVLDDVCVTYNNQ